MLHHLTASLLFFAFIGSMPHCWAQDSTSTESDLIPLLERAAMFYGYAGGMPFHTAFHQGITTRHRLLMVSPRIPALRDYLKLDDRQLTAIAGLQPLDMEKVREDHPAAIGDPNAEPDEQMVDSDYFAFLSADQFSRLNRIAVWFDGYAALSRRSVADELELSEETRVAISRTLRENRKELYLPYARYRFAAPLPPDHDYGYSEFCGKFVVHLNHQLIETLAADEARRLAAWMSADSPPAEVIEAIKREAPLPGGLDALRGFSPAPLDDEPGKSG